MKKKPVVHQIDSSPESRYEGEIIELDDDDHWAVNLGAEFDSDDIQATDSGDSSDGRCRSPSPVQIVASKATVNQRSKNDSSTFEEYKLPPLPAGFMNQFSVPKPKRRQKDNVVEDAEKQKQAKPRLSGKNYFRGKGVAKAKRKPKGKST